MSVDEIEALMRRRIETDEIIPVWLPFSAYLLAIIGELAILAGREVGKTRAGLGAGMLFAVVGGLIMLYVYYKWIDRRNKHFARSHALFNAVADYLERRGERDAASRIRSVVREMEMDETEKNPVLWILLSMATAGLAGLYILYFLTIDYYKHSFREAAIVEEVNKTVGGGHVVPIERLKERNFWLYILLTIITMGLFGLYWVYVLTDEPNKHFENHARTEDSLLRVLESLSAEA